MRGGGVRNIWEGWKFSWTKEAADLFSDTEGGDLFSCLTVRYLLFFFFYVHGKERGDILFWALNTGKAGGQTNWEGWIFLDQGGGICLQILKGGYSFSCLIDTHLSSFQTLKGVHLFSCLTVKHLLIKYNKRLFYWKRTNEFWFIEYEF